MKILLSAPKYFLYIFYTVITSATLRFIALFFHFAEVMSDSSAYPDILITHKMPYKGATNPTLLIRNNKPEALAHIGTISCGRDLTKLSFSPY